MANLNSDVVEYCRKNFRKGNITLYLGAGVSMDSGIPSWNKLVLAMYFATISEQQLPGWRPYPNYLYAIADWYLNANSEPLDITARKLLKFYQGEEKEAAFLERLYSTLYGNLLNEYGQPLYDINRYFLRDQNSTLAAIAKVCEFHEPGVSSVITYNYDNLLEMALGDFKYKAIFKAHQSYDDQLPIFHVHGYVPFDKNPESSQGFDIIFTEDKYNRISSDVYHWSNLVQIQRMANSVGIMVGLSLSDRNVRRLLDAVRRAPINSMNFALLQRSDFRRPDNETLDEIHRNAIKLLGSFRDSRIKSDQNLMASAFARRPGNKSDESGMNEKGPSYRYEISGIINAVKQYDLSLQEYVLDQLRITPIWYSDFREIPGILYQLLLG